MSDVQTETDEYKITRETRANSPYEYEFVLYVDEDGMFVEETTATEVAGLCGCGFDDIDNWTSVLEVYAEEFIESEMTLLSVEAVEEEYDL